MNWKPIPGYDLHEVSDSGLVRVIKGQKILKQRVNISGNGKEYLRVTLAGYRKDEKPFEKGMFVHVCVALAFLGPRPFPGAVVCHKDDNGFNNALSNLEWGSQSYNCFMKGKVGQERLPGVDEVGEAWEPDYIGEKALEFEGNQL